MISTVDLIDERQYIIPITDILSLISDELADLYIQPKNVSNQNKKNRLSVIVNQVLYAWTKAFDNLDMATSDIRSFNLNDPVTVNEIWKAMVRALDMRISTDLPVTEDDVVVKRLFELMGPYVALILREIDDGHILDRIEWSENLDNRSIIVTAFCLRIY